MTKSYDDDLKLREVLKAGTVPDRPIYKQFSVDDIKGIDTEALTIDFIISTSSVDRYGDTVEATGWDLKNYKKNPVVLFGHDGSSPPVAKCIPRSLEVKGKALTATAEFMPKDLYDFSYMLFQMYAKGFMKATSVGFRPLEWKFVEDGDRPFGVDFLKQELMEFSCVPIPANPEALVQAKSMGIELSPLKKWAEETLDTWEKHKGLLMPKSSVELLYKNSKTPTKAKAVEKIELFKIELDGKKVKSASKLTGDFTKGKELAIQISKGSDSSFEVTELDMAAATEVLVDAIKTANDPEIKGFIFEVGKTDDEVTYKKVLDIELKDTQEGGHHTAPDDPGTKVCSECGCEFNLPTGDDGDEQYDEYWCPCCGTHYNAGKAVKPEVVKAGEITVGLNVTVDKLIDEKVTEATFVKIAEAYIELGDALLDFVESEEKAFSKSRKSVRLANAIKEQSNNFIKSLDLKDNSVTTDEVVVEEVKNFTIVDDVEDDEFVSIEDAKGILKDFLETTEKDLSDKVSEQTKELINKIRGKVA